MSSDTPITYEKLPLAEFSNLNSITAIAHNAGLVLPESYYESKSVIFLIAQMMQGSDVPCDGVARLIEMHW